jgi:Ca2+-transporting ATPase
VDQFGRGIQGLSNNIARTTRTSSIVGMGQEIEMISVENRSVSTPCASDAPPIHVRQPHCRATDDVLVGLGSNAHLGLSEVDAKARLSRYGTNRLVTERAPPAWRKFLAQFTDILVILLIGAGIISATLWFVERQSDQPYEAIAIFAIVLLNAIMGYVQQARAEKAVEALRRMTAPEATVIRDGKRGRTATHNLVPGDIIVIEEGDTIPADARLIETVSLQTAEASLTGESVAVSKAVGTIAADAALGDRRNMVFSGTAAAYGRGLAVVTATGMATEMGRIAGMLESAPEERTPLQEELDRVGRTLGKIVVAIAVIMIGTILLVGDVQGFSALFEVLILGVALAVAAVPEGLPAIVTAVLSIGVQRMAKRKAIVRRLAAVETLGSADVIASDKTGTLTRNEMSVRRIVTASGNVHLTGTGYSPTGEARTEVNAGAEDSALHSEVTRALTAADRANNAVLQHNENGWSVQGDPTEAALIVAARKVGLEEQVLSARFERVGEIPFSSERKLMSTIDTDAERQAGLRIFTKGAPDVLLARCSHELIGEKATPLSKRRRNAIMSSNEVLASEALRTLGLAFRSLPADSRGRDPGGDEIEHDLVFLGLIGMMDPPREGAQQAVARAKDAGIRPIMITGDHPRTAAVIAAELGISDDLRAVTGAELERMSDALFDRTVRERSVYARVDPAHKMRIVDALQRQGATVAMTGDGINDAPALKAADIGIAMGISGTDVSKKAADIVLADDNFATIVAAVEEGRAIFSNIRKFLRYLLSSNIGEVMTMFFGVVLADVIGMIEADGGLILPLLATQILWINLVTDGAPALALGIDPASSGIMSTPPRPPKEGVITRRMWAGIFFVGAVMAAGTLSVVDASLPGGLIEGSGTIVYGQTMAFTTLTLFQLFNVFNARSDERSAFSQLFANGWLWAAVGFSLALHAAVVYAPFLQQAFSTVGLSTADWLLCTAVASSVLWAREVSKLVGRPRRAVAKGL